VPIRFKPAFFALALGRLPEVATSLADPEDLLGLSFAEALTGAELRSGGTGQAVDDTNSAEFVRLIEEVTYGEVIAKEVRAWISGLSEVIDPSLLLMFAPIELCELFCGHEVAFTAADLRAHVKAIGSRGSTKCSRAFSQSSASEQGRSDTLREVRHGIAPTAPGGLAALDRRMTVRAVFDNDLSP
jgi:E3 ubiquitin-protein ligase TRIP12